MRVSTNTTNRLLTALQVGVTAADTNRGRRAKSAFVAMLVAVGVFSFAIALTPDRSILERSVDFGGLGMCMAGVFTLHLSKKLQISFTIVVGLAMLILAALYFLHGNRDGDFYFFILIPAAAVAFLGARGSTAYLICILIAASVIVVADLWLPRVQHPWHISPINPDGWLFHSPDKFPLRPVETVSFFSVVLVVYGLCYAGASALRDANKQVESLLLNVLPSSIATRLMEAGELAQGGTIVDSFDEVSILFADIVGFTELSRRMEAGDLVVLLNSLFSRFDEISTRHGVEKIKTIGDAYMAVCGLPEPDDRHAERIADVALEMLREIELFNETSAHEINLRIGINAGPVVAGVIGRNKFIYDLWGDAVNAASRMESYGSAGTIQTTTAMYELLKNDFQLVSLGSVDVKGQGVVPTWQLIGRNI